MSKPKYQLLPELRPDEYRRLKDDIAGRGILVPVEYDEKGNVLDGHHRLKIWDELKAEGVKVPDYPRIIRSGLSEQEKRLHVRALNINRRHLTREQLRGLIADQLKETPQKSDRQIGDVLGVDGKTVGAVRRGLVAGEEIPQLDKATGADGKQYPRCRHAAIIAKNRAEQAQALKAISAMLPDSLPDRMIDTRRVATLSREYLARQRAESAKHDATIGKAKLLLGDFRERGSEITNESVDLVFTDPPYAEEYVPLYSDLSRFAARVLKPDGMLIAYAGKMYLPEVIARMGEHLVYWWAGAIVEDGAHPAIHSKMIFGGFRPILFYVRDGYKPHAWLEDTNKLTGKPDHTYHKWQQSIIPALYYIRKLTQKGGLVCDPFLGGGTTGAAAVSLGRDFIGIEVDPASFASARERIRQERKQ